MKQLVGKANSYSLISQKGEPEIKKTGKFGNTILAQSTDGKKVIVKQINRQVVNADIALAAMLREIKYTPKGNLFLSPIDFFEINQSVFLVRPFVEGKSLKEVLDEKILYKKLSRFQKIKIALLVLHALKELEEYQIVHRDIRPSNLLITNWNEVKQNSSITPEIKLIDFGLAQKKGEIFPENYRLPFAMIYAPPEQLLNKHHLVSSWSDIYAWGITFYEFFTTEKPWYSDNPEFLMNLQLNLPLPE
ncbi:MAG: protein kinase, partial [Bacteroidia bacterium]|nr:protein kinase [Bacteroidia bacterium]